MDLLFYAFPLKENCHPLNMALKVWQAVEKVIIKKTDFRKFVKIWLFEIITDCSIMSQ